MTWYDDLTAFAQRKLTDRVRDAYNARGVSDEQIESFRLGYLDRKLPPLEGADDFLTWAKGGEKLDDVMVLPLTTPLGEIRGFQFRHVDRARKGYQNFAPYKEEALLFGLGQAMPHVWRTETIWLVEGAFDLFPIQRHFPGVVATLTARVPESLVRVMRRLVGTVLVGYDTDPAGRSATRSFEKEYGGDFRVHPVYYPMVRFVDSGKPVKDPAELWEVWGDEPLGRFVRSTLGTVNPMEY